MIRSLFPRAFAAGRLALAGALLLCSGHGYGDVPVDAAFGHPAMQGYWGRIEQPLSPAAALFPDQYRVKARLVPKLASTTAVEQSVELKPQAASADARQVKLVAPPGTALGDYEELWIDHGSPGRCEMRLGFEAERAGLPVQIHGESGQARSGELLALRPDQEKWVEKDFLYILRRQLGTEDDGMWRYIRDGDFTVMQKRFHVPLAYAQALEFEFPSGTVLSGVNLFVSEGEHGRPNRLLSGGDFTSKTSDDGVRTRVRLDLSQTMTAYRQGHRSVYLAEVLIFYQGSPADVVANKPLRKLTLFGTLPPKPGQGGTDGLAVPLKTAKITATGWRSVADLRYLPPQAKEGLNLRSLVWSAQGDPACRAEVEGGRLVNLADVGRPRYQLDTFRLSQALGGPFLLRPGDDKRLEWLEFTARLPFAEAKPQPRRGSDGVELPGWGVKIASADPRFSVAATPAGLAFRGGGEPVSLEWATDFSVEREHRLIARFAAGAAQFPALAVEAELADGRRVELNLRPDQPLWLARHLEPGSRVRALRLRFEQGERPWTLADLSLFRPYLLATEEAFAATRPGWGEVKLVPSDVAAGPADKLYRDGDGVNARLEPGEGERTLSWTTPVDLPARDVLQLKLDYQLDGALAQGCWLRLEMTGDRGGRHERDLCPRDSGFSEGLAESIGRHFAPGERLVSLRWQAKLRLDAPALVSFSPSLGIANRPSALSRLDAGTALLIGEERRRPTLVSAPAISALSRNMGPAWIDFGDWKVGPSERLPWMTLADDGLFELKRIVLVGGAAPSPALESWRLSQRPPGPPPGLGKPAKLGLALIAAALFWLGWRLRLWQTLWRGLCAVARRTGDFGSRMLALGGRLLGRLVGRARWLNLGAAGAGLALMVFGGAAHLPWATGSGVFLLLAVGWHMARWSGVAAEWQLLSRRLFTLAWLGWFAWSLGANGMPGIPVLLAALSGPIWCYSVALRGGVGRVLHSITLLPVVLFGLALVCYAIGLMRKAEAGESVWFTVGAMLLIATWWVIGNKARPWVESRWPRLGARVYAARGGPLFVGALLALVISALLLWVGMGQLAAHVSTLFFYQLCLGAAFDVAANWRRRESGC